MYIHFELIWISESFPLIAAGLQWPSLVLYEIHAILAQPEVLDCSKSLNLTVEFNVVVQQENKWQMKVRHENVDYVIIHSFHLINATG